MSIATVQTRYCYGLKGNVANSVCYLDERTVLYPSGANLVLCNADQKMQKFIPLSPGSEGATALAVSPNKRYVAVAEKRSERPTITIFDVTTLRKKKVLNYADGTFQEYVSLGFSPDSKYLVSQGCAPDWTMCYWYWEKSRVMAQVKSNGNTTYHVREVSLSSLTSSPPHFHLFPLPLPLSRRFRSTLRTTRKCVRWERSSSSSSATARAT